MKIQGRTKIILYSIVHFIVVCYWGFLSIGLYVGFSVDEFFHRIGIFFFLTSNWPSYIVGVYRGYHMINDVKIYDAGYRLFYPVTILVNTIGWGLVGFVVGLIILAVKGRRK